MPAIALLLTALSLGPTLAAQARLQARPPAPGFSLLDQSGARRTLEEFRGKVVVLNFWATWCRPCLDEMPALDQAGREYASRGVAVLGVAVDERGWPAVTKVVARKRLSYPILMFTPDVARRFGGLKTLPHTVFIDRRGRIVATHDSAMNLAQLRKVIDTLLAEQP